MTTETRETTGFTIINDSNEENSSEVGEFTKYLNLFELVLPAAWIFAAAVGSYGSTIVHFLFLLFYSIGMNSTRSLSFSLLQWPILFVLLSLVYSLAYVLAEISIYYVSKTKPFAFPKELFYFDLFAFKSGRNFGGIYPVTQYIIIVIDFVYIFTRNSISISWFSRARSAVVGKLMVFIRFAFVVSMSVMCSTVRSKATTFLPIIFAILTITISCSNHAIPHWMANIAWSLLIIANACFLALSVDGVIESIVFEFVPRWALIMCSCINTAIVGVLIGINRSNASTKTRLVASIVTPSFVKSLSPFLMLVISGVFCLSDLSWQSLSCIFVACLTSFFGTSILTGASRFIYAIDILVVCGQTVVFQLTSAKRKDTQIMNFVVYLLLGISCYFVSGSPQVSASNLQTTEQREVKPWLTELAKYIMTIFTIGMFISSAVFSSLNPVLSFSFPLFIVLVITIFQLYHTAMWFVLMGGTFCSMIFHLVVALLPGQINIPWLINAQSTEPERILKDLWPLIMLFVLAAICRYYFTEPPIVIVAFLKSATCFILLCLATVFIKNSILTVIYQITIILYLFFPRIRSALIKATSIFMLLHLLTLQVFNFPQIKALSKSVTWLMIFGLKDQKLSVLWPSVVLISFIISASFSSKFDSHLNAELPTWANTIQELFWFVMSKFSFYLFWLSIYLCVAASNGVSIIGSLFTVVLGLTRIFDFHSNKLGKILFIIFVLDVLLMTTSDLCVIPESVLKVFYLIGPHVETPLQKFINICVSLTAVLYTGDMPENIEINSYILAFGHTLSSLLLTVVQLCLTILAVKEKNVLSFVGSFIILLILIKPKVSKFGARILSIVLILILSYTMLFRIISFNKLTKWTEYFLLTSDNVFELTMLFIVLFSFSLYYDYGVIDVAFGPTFLTAYSPVIIISICSLISLHGRNYMMLIHSFLLMFNIIQTSYHKEYHATSLNYCIFFAFFSILLKAVRPLPLFSQTTTIYDIIFGSTQHSDFQWVFIFSLEFLLRCCLAGPQYNEVHQKELQRGEFRKQRAEIIDEMYEINTEYTKVFFEHSLNKLKEGFVSLSLSVEQMTSVRPLQVYQKAQITEFNLVESEGDEQTSPRIAEPGNEHADEQGNATSGTDEPNENTPQIPEQPEVQTESTLFLKIVMAALGFLKNIAIFCVDKILLIILYLTDVNLEAGVNIGFLTSLRQLSAEVLQTYCANDAFFIPEKWNEFVKSIPHSFLTQFQILHKLKKHEITPENRWQIVYRYIKICTRQLIPLLLMLMCFFYPMNQQTIIGIIYFIIALVCVSFNIETYMPYVIFSVITVVFRTFTQLPGIQDLVYRFVLSIDERQRVLKISTVFGLNPSVDQIVYEFTVFILSFVAQVYSFTHPFQTRRPYQHKQPTVIYSIQYETLSFMEKLKRRFNFHSSHRIPLSEIVLIIEIFSFLMLLIFYNSWTRSTTLNSMISGTSTISSDYVISLIGHFTFMMFCQVFSMSQSPVGLFVTNLLYSIFTFIYLVFFIPYRSAGSCYLKGSFNFYFFLRLFSSSLFCQKLLSGFDHLPPHISKNSPITSYISNLIINTVPFLFEFISVVKWIASTTAVSIWDKLIIDEMKTRLTQRQAANILFQPDSKKKNSTIGYILLFVMICLLFVPFLIMMGSSSTSTPNPLKIATITTGIFGLPDFFEATYILTPSNFVTKKMQDEILELNNSDLWPFYLNPPEHTQFFSYPSVTMTNWLISEASINYALNEIIEHRNTTSFVPFVKISYKFDRTTTKNKVETISLTKQGQDLNSTQLDHLALALNATKEGVPCQPINLTIPKLLPFFYVVPQELKVEDFPSLAFDAVFSIEITKSGAIWNVNTAIPSDIRLPQFVTPGKISSLIFSQPSFDAIVSSLLSSTGGFLGLYAFIIITIGQFLRMFVNSYFDDLWIDRMPDTDKILNVILAIEAHRDAGDLEAEYRTAIMLLNAIRSKHNIIKLTGMKEA